MSRQAIAAALAREDLSCGERLVAFSLASFADRENRARPGTPAAAARAGLARSRFLEARDRLVRRGLVVVERCCERAGSGEHGRAAVRGDGSVVGGRDQRGAVRGGARLQPHARPRAAAARRDGGPGKRAGRRRGRHDRAAVRGGGGGRQDLSAGAGDVAGIGRGGPSRRIAVVGGTRTAGRSPTRVLRRARPRRHAPARSAAGGCPPADGDRRGASRRTRKTSRRSEPRSCPTPGSGVGAVKGGQDRTVSTQKGPVLTGVSSRKGGQDRTLPEQNRPAVTGVSAVKGGQDRTVSLENPGKNPGRKPRRPTRARVGNPRTPEPLTPPAPLKGGAALTRFWSRRRTSPSVVVRRRRLVAGRPRRGARSD